MEMHLILMRILGTFIHNWRTIVSKIYHIFTKLSQIVCLIPKIWYDVPTGYGRLSDLNTFIWADIISYLKRYIIIKLSKIVFWDRNVTISLVFLTIFPHSEQFLILYFSHLPTWPQFNISAVQYSTNCIYAVSRVERKTEYFARNSEFRVKRRDICRNERQWAINQFMVTSTLRY